MSAFGRAPVIFLVPDFFGPPGGIARYCQMVARALQTQGIPLHIIALHDNSTPPPPHHFAHYQACGSSKIKFVQAFLAQFLKVRPAMVVVGHCHFAPIAAWLCKVTQTPYSVFLYGIEVWERLSTSRRWAVANATSKIAISHHTAAQASEINGWDLNKIEVLYNCLDPELATPATTASVDSQLSILTVSRLSREDSYKGLDVVLNAIPRLLQEFPALTYHIVGDGNARGDLEALAQELNIAHAVRFHGRVSDATLRTLYAQSTVYVMPSRNEGFGFVFLEAMAQGTPAIGGNVDATPEVIEHGVTGFTVDPHSPEAVADATATLLRDPDLRNRMGQAAYHRAHQVFGFDAFQSRLWNLLQGNGAPQRTTPAKSLP